MLVQNNQIELTDGFTLEHEDKLITIIQDSNGQNPRDWDNVSVLMCFHGNYKLGDDQTDLPFRYGADDFDGWKEMREQLEADYKPLAVLPLYLYDHSGITMRTTPFGDHWDSGMVGWGFITEARLVELGIESRDKKTLEKIIVDEVKLYDQYLQGEVYGFRLEELQTCNLGHEHSNEVDACWGFFERDGLVEALNDNFSREAK